MTTETYHLSKITSLPFDDAVDKITRALQEEGFGIITRIDLKETFKNKLNIDFRPYLILGACNPRFAYEALLAEDKVGVFLPCNVVVQQHPNGQVEVSAIDPLEMMRPVDSIDLKEFAQMVRQMLNHALAAI